jgi:hypothetical protein
MKLLTYKVIRIFLNMPAAAKGVNIARNPCGLDTIRLISVIRFQSTSFML